MEMQIINWLQSLMMNLLEEVRCKSPLIRFDALHIDLTVILLKWNQSAVRKIQFTIWIWLIELNCIIGSLLPWPRFMLLDRNISSVVPLRSEWCYLVLTFDLSSPVLLFSSSSRPWPCPRVHGRAISRTRRWLICSAKMIRRSSSLTSVRSAMAASELFTSWVQHQVDLMFDWSRVSLRSAQRLRAETICERDGTWLLDWITLWLFSCLGRVLIETDELSELLCGQRCVYTCSEQPHLKVEGLL